jgi:Na+/melibiose symporter-like transporter
MFKGAICALLVALLLTIAYFYNGLTQDGVKVMVGVWCLAGVCIFYDTYSALRKNPNKVK